MEDNLKKHRLYVDMDGTLAVFNKIDTLEALYEEGYFLSLKPIHSTINAVREIVKNTSDVEVYILSAVLSDSRYAGNEKNAWLDKYLPEIDRKHRIFTICGEDKKNFIDGGVKSTDFLLDDYTKNLINWSPPGMGIKLLNGINHTNESWKSNCIRYDSSYEAIAEKIVKVIKKNSVIKEQKPQEKIKKTKAGRAR